MLACVQRCKAHLEIFVDECTALGRGAAHYLAPQRVGVLPERLHRLRGTETGCFIDCKNVKRHKWRLTPSRHGRPPSCLEHVNTLCTQGTRHRFFGFRLTWPAYQPSVDILMFRLLCVYIESMHRRSPHLIKLQGFSSGPPVEVLQVALQHRQGAFHKTAAEELLVPHDLRHLCAHAANRCERTETRAATMQPGLLPDQTKAYLTPAPPEI